MWRLLVTIIFCFSALYGLQISKPVITRDPEDRLVSIANLSVKNNSCLSKQEILQVKNIQFHPAGNYIYLLTFADDDNHIFSATTNFYKLNDSDTSQLNQLIHEEHSYFIRYYLCQNETNQYSIDGIYFRAAEDKYNKGGLRTCLNRGTASN